MKNPNLASNKLSKGIKTIAHLGIVYKSGEVCFNAATDVMYMEKLRSFTMKDTNGNDNRYDQIRMDRDLPTKANNDFDKDIFK